VPNEIGIEVKAKETGLEKIESDARKTGSRVAKEVGDGFDKAGDAAARAGKKISSDLDKVADDARGAGERAGSGFGEALSDGLGDLDMGDAVSKGAAGVLAGGALIGAKLLEGLQSVWQEDAIGGMIAAQNGGSAAQARRLGDTVGDAFFDGFGASMEDVGDALSAVVGTGLIDMDAPAAELDKLTKMAVTASAVVGEEATEISRAAQQLLRNGLAGSAAEAIDIIVGASQNGMNIAGDLLDTITEYGTQFRVLGLNAEQGLGLVSQAMKAGARDSDVAADALKEFAIRAQDGSESTARGFRTIGLDARKMAQEIGAGGDRASSALGLTLDKLRAIEDPVLRSQAAVDLFGTKAEDLGSALYSMDLDTAAEGMGALGGSTDEARAAIEATTPAVEKLGRNLEGMFNKFVGGIESTNRAMEGLPEGMQGFEGLDLFSPDQEESANNATEAINDAADATNTAATANLTYVETIDQVIDAQRAAAEGSISLSEASIGAQEALVDAHEAVEKFAGEGLNAAKSGFNLSTEAGREMEGSLNDIASTTWDVVEAMRAEGATSQEVETYIRGQRGELIRAARQMGLNEDAAHRYADELLGIPRTVETTARFNAAHARTALQSVLNRIRQIPDEVRTDYYLYTHTLQGSGGSVRDYDPNYGGRGGRAHGGIIGGDEVPRAASGGVRSSTVQINDGTGIGELVELPNGSRVMTAGTTRAMAEAGLLGGGGEQRIVLELRSGGSRMDDLLIELIQRAGKARGGDPVRVLSGSSR
jgi:phage-related minor tail protein